MRQEDNVRMRLEIFFDVVALFTQLLDFTAGMKHGGMVTATKRIANFRQAVVGELFGHRHRHLTRTRTERERRFDSKSATLIL